MKLEWSHIALADREAIFDYLLQGNYPPAAVEMDERIQSQTESLLRFPKKGRAGRVDGTRELIITQTPYIAAYTITDKTVLILRILHGAQSWPHEMPEI